VTSIDFDSGVAVSDIGFNGLCAIGGMDAWLLEMSEAGSIMFLSTSQIVNSRMEAATNEAFKIVLVFPGLSLIFRMIVASGFSS
jgi:hypothetical protein